MTNKEKVSVLLSAYNAENTIAKSIESLILQTYKNIEILIMDDNSSDLSFKICKDYESNYENIQVFKNENNVGLTKNLNFLINISKGKYLARQDADDISESTRIEKQITFMKHHNLDACTTRAFVINQNKITPNISMYLPKKLIIRLKNPFIHGTLVIKKSSIIEVGNYNEKFYYSQDYKLMKDLIERNFNVKILKSPLYHLNMKGNISEEKKDEQEYYANCVRKNIEPRFVK